jgi:hypothetical protein
MPKTSVRSLSRLVLCVLLPSAVALGAPARSPAPAKASPEPAEMEVGNSVRSGRQAQMLLRRWGIDDVHVRSTASGSVIRFSYRVVDAEKARVLNDKNAHPYMIVKKSGAKLEVPTAEKVGQLRQTAPAENGREYWMVFTNLGRTLKPGDHVDVVIATFRGEELVVESAGPAAEIEKKP